MISRRLLRIKVLQILYAYFIAGKESLPAPEKTLRNSIEYTYDLYNYLIFLILEIYSYAAERIEMAKQKQLPSYEDLNPNTKFINNIIIRQLSENNQLNEEIKRSGLSWKNKPELIKNIYQQIIDSNTYKEYMGNKDHNKNKTAGQGGNNYNEDKKLIINIYKNNISTSELLFQTLEEENIFWNDDIEFVISMIIKTVKNFTENSNENTQLLPLYKNEEDRKFAGRLLSCTINNSDEYKDMIERFSKNWDIERVVFMDIVIMQILLSEILEFPDIPVKVSMNEYLEISKYYSTKKSFFFINGVTENIITLLKKTNRIKKSERGMQGGL